MFTILIRIYSVKSDIRPIARTLRDLTVVFVSPVSNKSKLEVMINTAARILMSVLMILVNYKRYAF